MALEEKLDTEQHESTIASQIASALKGLRFDNRSSLDRQQL
jgi:hypothetical protein